MTICFFSAQYLPTVGGVERYTFNLARRVGAAGHTALVVTSALPGLPEDETDEYGIRLLRRRIDPAATGLLDAGSPAGMVAMIMGQEKRLDVLHGKSMARYDGIHLLRLQPRPRVNQDTAVPPVHQEYVAVNLVGQPKAPSGAASHQVNMLCDFHSPFPPK